MKKNNTTRQKETQKEFMRQEVFQNKPENRQDKMS